MTTRRYYWIPDRKDLRDCPYEKRKGPRAKLPLSVDLRSRCSPVEDQGSLGSCTAHALVANMEFLEESGGEAFSPLSRLFVYFNERQIEGDISEDHGARLRDGIKSLKQWGVCPERQWPYRPDLVFEKPPSEAYARAAARKVSKYERLKTLEEMKDCLASGSPFVFGFVVYPSFESIEVTRTGLASMPKPGEQPLGGHAVMAVGYDDATHRITAKNSWGSSWGDSGFFSLPYEYLTQGLAGDFWSIKK